MYLFRDTIPFFCHDNSPLNEKHCRDYIIFLICRSFRSSSSWYSSGSFYFGYYDFLFFFEALLDNLFKAANGINCFARSSRFIRPLCSTFMPSYLTVPFHRSGSCLQVYPFQDSVFPELFFNRDIMTINFRKNLRRFFFFLPFLS